MNGNVLIKKLVESVGDVPTRAEVYAVRQYSLDEMKQRTKRFLAATAEAYTMSLDRGDWSEKRDRTLVHLPQGARAVLFHGSGAIKFIVGLEPMESLFEKMEDRDSLTKQVEDQANRLKIRDWAGTNGSIDFERLWQIKAGAADRQGQVVNPVLCRIVGAYRHSVGKLPVWGPASVAVKLAGGGQLDSITMFVRETTGEVVDRAEVLAPDRAAHDIHVQLCSLMGNSKISLDESASPQWMRFGYLSLNKRKPQRVLAPVYVAAIEIERQEEAQAYLFVARATEKTYLPLERVGSDASSALASRIE